MSEQTSLLAASTGDDAWLDRITTYEPVARLGETFLLNSQVTQVPVSSTRLIAPGARSQVGAWLAETLAPDAARPEGASICERPGLTDDEVFDLVGLSREQVPEVYQDWRLAVELYVVLDDLVFCLMDGGFVRYRRLAERDLAALLSGQMTPFMSFDESVTGRVVILTAVPARLGALGGLRGYRSALMAAGEAMARLSASWASRERATTWEWHTEFVDDVCARAFGWDGLERVPLAIAYQRDGQPAEDSPGGESSAQSQRQEETA